MLRIVYRLLIGMTLIGGFVMMSCQRENQCHIPIGNATCTIDLTMPDAYPLNTPGGMVYAYGGYKGLWIGNNGGGEYVVWEAACPIDNEVAVVKDTNFAGVLVCPKCHSMFNGIDGMPMSGSATYCPLRQYSAYRDGHLLYISN